MVQAQCFTLILACLVGACISQTTNGVCYGQYNYRCVGLYHFQQCSTTNPNEEMGDIFPCTILTGNVNSMCIPHQFSSAMACRDPISCTTAGRFNLGDPVANTADRKWCPVFFECQDGGNGTLSLHISDCRPGYEFSPITRTCLPESIAGCSLPTNLTTPPTVTTVTTPEPTTLPPCTTQGRFHNPYNCRQYYDCSADLVATLFTCPFNTLFNIATSRCATTVDCGTRFNPLVTTTTPSSR